MTPVEPTVAPRAVAAPSPARLASFRAAVDHATQLIARLAALDVGQYESFPAHTAVQALVEGPVAQALGATAEAVRLIVALPSLFGDSPARPDSDQEIELELDLGGGEPIDGAAPVVSVEHFGQEIESALDRITAAPRPEVGVEQLDGLCQMLARSLRSARDQLGNARQQASKWGLISNTEEVRRKTERALRAGLTAAGRLLGIDPATLQISDEHTELASALEVREALMGFRADVLGRVAGAEGFSPEVQRAAALGSLDRIAALKRHEVYTELRALDRFTLQQLRERLERWLAGGAEPEAGRQVLLDLFAFADLLTAVNNREILVQRDRALKREASEELEACLALASVQPRQALAKYRAVLERVRGLRWRDEHLAAALDAELARAGESEVEASIISALSLVGAVRV